MTFPAVLTLIVNFLKKCYYINNMNDKRQTKIAIWITRIAILGGLSYSINLVLAGFKYIF